MQLKVGASIAISLSLGISLVSCGTSEDRQAAGVPGVTPPPRVEFSVASYALLSKADMLRESDATAVVVAESVSPVKVESPPITSIPKDDPKYPYSPGYAPTPTTQIAAEMKARVVIRKKGPAIKDGQQIRIRFMPSSSDQVPASLIPIGKKYLVFLDNDRQADSVYFSLSGPYTIYKDKGGGSKSTSASTYEAVVANEAVPTISDSEVP